MYAHEDEEEETGTEGGALRPHKSSRDALLHSIEGADSRWVTCSSYVRSDLPWVVVLIERVCVQADGAREACDGRERDPGGGPPDARRLGPS